jgi:hypothetical protein
MDRRSFLKTLASLGASVAFPIDLATASSREIDTVWKKSNLAPTVFTVAPHGTLSIGEYEEPGTRSEMYGIEMDWASREELADVIECNWQLEEIAEAACADCQDEDPDQDWRTWLQFASQDDYAYLEARVQEWLETKPDVGAEYEWLPPMNLITPESRAYSFFKMQDEDLLANLGIVFVEGDHPGSSYFGAELHQDLDVVNAICVVEEIPMRFVAEQG